MHPESPAEVVTLADAVFHVDQPITDTDDIHLNPGKVFIEASTVYNKSYLQELRRLPWMADERLKAAVAQVLSLQQRHPYGPHLISRVLPAH